MAQKALDKALSGGCLPGEPGKSEVEFGADAEVAAGLRTDAETVLAEVRAGGHILNAVEIVAEWLRWEATPKELLPPEQVDWLIRFNDEVLDNLVFEAAEDVLGDGVDLDEALALVRRAVVVSRTRWTSREA